MEWEDAARKHGVPQHRVVTWVRRKLGPDLSLVRWTAHGVGCAAPCVFCTRVLIKYDLRVHCPLGDGGWYSGRMDEPCAPAPVLTSGQRRSMGLEPTPGRPCPSGGMGSSMQGGGAGRVVCGRIHTKSGLLRQHLHAASRTGMTVVAAVAVGRAVVGGQAGVAAQSATGSGA